MIICAGDMESFNFASPVGIGMVDVSINLTKMCLDRRPEFLLFVGSAGSYGNKKIFDIIESKSATNIENSFLEGSSYTPIDNMVSTSTNVSHETLVNSSNYITTNRSISNRYLSKNIELENMEFYAVLKVAQKFSIPCAGVFIVTNYCYEDAHKEFKSNHVKAMELLAKYMDNKAKII